jgi:elongation factor G
MDSQDGFQVITAQVPQSELFTYATELKSLTGGRGTFSSSLDRYDELPSHLTEKVVAEHRKEGEGASGH